MIFKTNTKVILLEHDARSLQDIQDLWKWQIIRIAVIFHTWWQISWCYNVIMLQATSGIPLDNRLWAAAQWSDNLIWRECSALISPVSPSPQSSNLPPSGQTKRQCWLWSLSIGQLQTDHQAIILARIPRPGHLIGSFLHFLMIQELTRTSMSGKLKTSGLTE